jgi:hypothetical protein
MSAKANRKTRRQQFASQMQAANNAAAITLERPAPPPIRLYFVFEQGLATLRRAWKWMHERSKLQRKSRKLRVCESAQLGDKKFVALIQADGQRFLIGGTSTSISLLAALPSRKSTRSQAPKAIPFEVRES